MGLLAKLERRNTSTLSNPEPWLYRALGIRNLASGVSVSEEGSLSSSAMLQGVRLVSETVASVPLKLYKARADRGRDTDRAHPTYRVLHDEPNEEQTAMEFRQMIQCLAITGGTGYAEIVLDGGGRLLELWPITPHRVTAFRDAAHRLWYRVTTPGGEDRKIPHERMFRIPGFSRNGILGLDIVNTMRESIGLTLATEQFGAHFFGQGAHPIGALEVPKRMSNESHDRLRDDFERLHSGLDNSHRVAILEEGAKWVAMGTPPEAAQFLETRRFQVTEVARILNVPPHMLMDLERATFSNIEHQAIQLVIYTMRPWWVRWEQRIGKQLLLPSEREEGYYAEHVAEGLLRGDSTARAAFYKSMFDMGVYSPNDIAEHENMNPVPGGDQRFVQMNLVPLVMAAELAAAQITPADPDDDDDERALPRAAFRALCEQTGDHIVSREANALTRAIKRAYTARGAQDLHSAMDDFYAEHQTFIGERCRPLLLAMTGAADTRLLGNRANDFARELVEASLAELRAILRDSEPEDAEVALVAKVEEWRRSRPASFASRVLEFAESIVKQSAVDAA